MHSDLLKQSDHKRRTLKSKQTYLSSQSRKLDERMPGVSSLEDAEEILLQIYASIDELNKEKQLHHLANSEGLQDLELSVNNLLVQNQEITDCVYGIVQFIQE